MKNMTHHNEDRCPLCPDGRTPGTIPFYMFSSEIPNQDIRAEVYFNLPKRVWSVRDQDTKRVVAHCDYVNLENVTFHVSEKGRQRVEDERQKNVHAMARGTLCGVRLDSVSYMAGYNPYQVRHFCIKERYSDKLNPFLPIRGAEHVILLQGGEMGVQGPEGVFCRYDRAAIMDAHKASQLMLKAVGDHDVVLDWAKNTNGIELFWQNYDERAKY